MLLEAIIFFSLTLGVTSLVALQRRTIRSRFWLSLPLTLGALALSAWLGSVVLHDPAAALALSVGVAGMTLLVRLWQSRWSWLGALLFTSVTVAALCYLAYAADITYASGLPGLIVALSTLLLLLELFAL